MSARRALRALVLYAGLSVVLTWPYAVQLRTMEPGDSAYFAWAQAWALHTLTTDPGSLPHGNIYHPERWTLGMDEPILGSSLLMLPLWPFTRDAVLLLNLLRFAILILCGFHTWLLARELGCREGPALLAGAAFAFSPLRLDQVGHLSTLGAQWLPLVLLFLHRYLRRGRLRDALACGACFALAAWACGYHGIIGLAVLPLAALPLLWGRWRRLPGLALGGVVALLGLLPLERLHRLAFRAHGFERGRDEALLYSASLEAFLAAHDWNRLYGTLTEPFRHTGGGTLFPGLVLPALALWGIARLLRERQRPSRIALALAALALASALVALGPEIRVAGHSLMTGPFEWLRESVPTFRFIRVTTRAGVFIALALALAAGLALRPWSDRPRRLAVVAGLALAETLIVPIPTPEWAKVIDSGQPPPPVYAWLARQPGDVAVVELPMLPNDGRFRNPAFHESIYMVRSTLHWKPIVNGYAGVEPRRYRVIRELSRRFPDSASLRSLRGAGVRYAIVHWRGYGPNRRARLERELPGAPGLRLVQRFGEDSVYELVDPAAVEP